MATVYAPPVGFDPPDFDDSFINGHYDMAKDDAVHQAYFDRLAEEAYRINGDDPLLGEIVRFPIADGYAVYMVWKLRPLELIHLPIHDAWQIPDAHARGLRLSDIRSMVASAKALRELFARKP